MSTISYEQFLQAKVAVAPKRGFEIKPSEVNTILKPHQRDTVVWNVAQGCAADFHAFGLGKSVIQLETLRLILKHADKKRGLIIAPLGVRQEFMRDAKMLGLTVTVIRTTAEAKKPGLYLTNYEAVRDGKVDASEFDAVSLDEAAILRGFGGTKTFREFMASIAGDDRRDHTQRKKSGGVRFRFVATATPSPNEYIELLAYAAFLGVMDVSAAKTRFFKRDSTKADNLTLHPHKEAEFWKWVSTWALFVSTPSDLGHSDEGYVLPPLKVVWHELPTKHSSAGADRDGQGLLIKNAALGVTAASKEKRESLDARVAKVRELIAGKQDQAVVWCDLNDEQNAIEQGLEADGVSASSLYGSYDVTYRERLMQQWRDKDTEVFLSKPSMYGAGVNLQQANLMIFAGIGFKFHEVIQAVHRIYRFLQTRPCEVHFIYTEAEREIRKSLEDKWGRHVELVAQMTAIVRQHGLANVSKVAALTRSLGVKRDVAEGKGWTLAHNDCVDEMARLKANSVGMFMTSVPFATQYEYSPSYNDFGHTDDVPHFMKQMDYLTPQLYRALAPGRILAVHVKDRVTPCGVNGNDMGFQVVDPFSDACVAHYRRHGFGFLSRITIVTDVVRENAQTYRLGWTEQCKDGTRMGNGMPEYLLVFRKAPTDRSNGYADVPVVKDKAVYTRARWQFDAHGYHRSSGNRLLTPADLRGLAPDKVFKVFKQHSLSKVYDLEHDVTLAEFLDSVKMLPPSFMLLQPQSWHPEVWTDVARMRTLNTLQAQQGKEHHLCPLPFDIVERAIAQYTAPGDLVVDPFAGVGTVPYMAVKLGRRGHGSELSRGYWQDGVWHLQQLEAKIASPELFDLPGTKEEAAA
jgi:hypothetical protein